MTDMKMKKTFGEKIFDCANVLILLALTFITLYPCWYVLVASVSEPAALYNGSSLIFWPRNFGLYSYETVLGNTELWTGYRNTIFYVAAGTLLSVLLTTSAAFCASRKDLPGKNTIMLLFTFTMYFAGGMIPTYLLVRNLGILNTPLAMILPHAVNTYNLIITLSYFRSIPDALEEAAKIDGAGTFTIFWRIMMPLAKPIIAVISLYYAVAYWNDYMSALLYITDKDLKPLQMVLREILLTDGTTGQGEGISMDEGAAYAANIRYATIVVSTIPILCVYPFVQRYFIKGVMIGAVKG